MTCFIQKFISFLRQLLSVWTPSIIYALFNFLKMFCLVWRIFIFFQSFYEFVKFDWVFSDLTFNMWCLIESFWYANWIRRFSNLWVVLNNIRKVHLQIEETLSRTNFYILSLFDSLILMEKLTKMENNHSQPFSKFIWRSAFYLSFHFRWNGEYWIYHPSKAE